MIIKTDFEGLRVLKCKTIKDRRGFFKKIFNSNQYEDNQLKSDFKEIYYTKSKKNVIRGMHFQIPPYEHCKLVSIVNGEVLDVVLDLRKHSMTYGKFFSIYLREMSDIVIYIPKGFAHGFKSLQDNTVVEYYVTSVYNSEFDCGIRWDSFGFDWQIQNPIISERDKGFPPFIEFMERNPFK